MSKTHQSADHFPQKNIGGVHILLFNYHYLPPIYHTKCSKIQPPPCLDPGIPPPDFPAAPVAHRCAGGSPHCGSRWWRSAQRCRDNGQRSPSPACLTGHLWVVNWEKSQSWLVVSTHPSEKCESQLGLLFPIYGKTKNVPDHEPEMGVYGRENHQWRVWQFFLSMGLSPSHQL